MQEIEWIIFWKLNKSKMKKEYRHRVGIQFDNTIYEIEMEECVI